VFGFPCADEDNLTSKDSTARRIPGSPGLAELPSVSVETVAAHSRDGERVNGKRRSLTVDQAVPALVLGNGVTVLGVLRILGRAGIPYYVLNRADPLLARSRSFRPLPARFGTPTPGSLSGWLRSLDIDRAVLLPCSDIWATEVARADAEVRARFRASIAPPDTLERLVDKGRFAQTLAELAIPRPWSQVLSEVRDLDAVPEERLDGAFLKPRDSQRFIRTFNVKAFMVESRAEAVRLLGKAHAAGLHLILQEYIPGPASNHFFIDGFVDRRGRIRTLFARQRLRMYPKLFGNSTYMRSARLDEVPGAVDSITRLLRGITYRGVFSAEFKLDARDGVFKILEVNARPWWYIDFAARCGVDVASMAYHDALGTEVSQIDSYSVDRHCVYPYPDFGAFRELWRKGEVGLWGWLRSWVGAVQPVFDWRDPWPAAASNVGTIIRKVARLHRRRS
jgi:D-aspartate ligase